MIISLLTQPAFNMEQKENPFNPRNNDRPRNLNDFSEEYTIEIFFTDLSRYFVEDIDFNMEKIREYIDSEGRFERLLGKARQHKTHPVTEFVRDLFSELGKSGDTKWQEDL